MNRETANPVWESFWSLKRNHEWWTHAAPEIEEFVASQSAQIRPDVLDLGCGLGRHAILFAQAGFRVTAVDGSPAAIRRLREWADRLSLRVQTEVCDFLGGRMPPASFDIILSYNVIYHGRREKFAAAIDRVCALLRPGGLFYFTCPTRNDGKYGFGRELAPHTFECEKSITPGDIHYFADEADLDELLSKFRLRERTKREGRWNNEGEDQFYSNWHVLAEKI
ncbi:MAG: class I SAM-dependent methyltransferase [Candidatus Hydrogenedentes bacterium]|nr:class I SAM-dependent methyltransferase [Candidatus Hydrogenedentota bacterium]